MCGLLPDCAQYCAPYCILDCFGLSDSRRTLENAHCGDCHETIEVGAACAGVQQLERAPGARTDMQPDSSLERGSEYRAVLTDSDIAPTTAHRWQTVAQVPDVDPTKAYLCRAIRLINSVIRLNVKHLLQNCDRLIDWQVLTLVGRYGILFL